MGLAHSTGLSLLQLPYARLAPKASTFPHLPDACIYSPKLVTVEVEQPHTPGVVSA